MGPAIDQVGKDGIGDAAKSDLQTNLSQANLLTSRLPQGEEGSEGRGSDLEELLELKPTVASFLQALPETSDKEGEKTPPEPDIMDFAL